MNHKFKLSALASAFALTLTACGGGSSEEIAGIGGSGYISTGTVTGFGSVYVNGIKYETDSTDFNVEGFSATQNELAIGMVVKVEGTVNDDGLTGTATRIVFDDELQGPILNLTQDATNPDIKTFNILGVNVKVDRRRTEFDDDDAQGFNFDTLANDITLEVSGFFDAAGTLNATYIDRDDDLNEIKIQGAITNLTATTFVINGQTVDFSTAQLDDSLIPVEGLWVKVEGTIDTEEVLIASEIEEVYDESYDDNAEIEIEGFISDFVSSNNFKVNGINVDASSVSLSSSYTTLGNNVWIEVEGTYVNNVLIANEIELRDGEIEIDAIIDQVNTDGSFSITVGGQTIVVQTGYETKFDFEDGSNQLSSGQFVEIDGYQIDENTLFALEVDVEDSSSEENELQGVYQGTNINEDIIKILNVEFTVDSNTDFGDLVDMTNFLNAAIAEETLIKIEYDNDGVVTKVEIEESDEDEEDEEDVED